MVDKKPSALVQPYLDRRGVVILDGALATELEQRGADLRDPLWSAKVLLEDPALIRQVHRDYLEAGSDVITSASYQASFEGFARRGLDRRQAEDMLRLSVRLAQEARADFLEEQQKNGTQTTTPLVAASVGCYGAILHDGSEYRGDYGLSVIQLMDWHRPRLEVLAQSGADLLACETIPCAMEAEALVRLLEEFPDMPAWLSFSCRDGSHVCHGETLVQCVQLAETRPNIFAVGVNCTAPKWVPNLLHSLAGRTSKLLLTYPNSGETWDAKEHLWGQSTSCLWAEAALNWYGCGAKLIGGCCRTNPAIIRQIAGVFIGKGPPNPFC
jgi:homocysteine S-methyltransferase